MSPNCSNSQFFGYNVQVLPLEPPPLPWLHDLVNSLFINLTPVYLSLATIGNALSVVVFRRVAMSSMSNGFILIAITDLLVLFVSMLEICLHLKGYVNPCKILIPFLFLFIQKGFLTFGHWLLVLVSIEQTLAIFRPKTGRAAQKLSGGKICCLYMSLLIFTLFINLPYLFTVLLLEPVLIDFYQFMNTFDSIITGAVPFVIMFGLDVAILAKLCTKGKRDLKGSESNQKGEITLSKEDKRERKNKKDAVHGRHETGNRSRALEGAVVIFAMNVAAILFDISYSVVTFLQIINRDFISLSVILIFTRHAFNFCLYFFSFQFRKEFFSLLCRCCQYPSPRESPLRTAPLQSVTGRLGV